MVYEGTAGGLWGMLTNKDKLTITQTFMENYIKSLCCLVNTVLRLIILANDGFL